MKSIVKTLTACLSLAAAAPVAADTYVGSWNIVHLGWDNEKNYEATAEVATKFDLLAVQEVMTLEGLQRLEKEMEARSGVDWESFASEAVGRGSYKEHYAFIWRPDRVSWVDGAVTYIDDRDSFAREPFSMRFQTADGYRFVYAAAHAIYGDTIEGREDEARAFRRYLDWLNASFDGDPVYLAGDFNLPPSNEAWSAVGEVSYPAIQGAGVATTLSKKNGRYANLYDQIWMPSERPVPIKGVGVYKFPEHLGMSHKMARKSVSDHAPVFIVLSDVKDRDASWVTFPDHSPVSKPANLNRAPASKQVTSATQIKGNRNSNIFHLPHCPGFSKVSARNAIYFDTEAAAKTAGFRMARNCD